MWFVLECPENIALSHTHAYVYRCSKNQSFVTRLKVLYVILM